MRMIGRYASLVTVLLRGDKNKLVGVSSMSRYVVCCVGAEFFCQKTSDASLGWLQLLQAISTVGTKKVSLPSPFA